MRENSILGLASIRGNRGITLEQIAESTKISIRSLKAIEEGAFSKLPGGIYNTSYIRQYARAIDFDEARLLDYYKASMNLNIGEPATTPKGGSLLGGLRPLAQQ